MPSIASPTSTLSDHISDDAPSRRKSRVSAEHTLNRVRENQRRHRARQRDRVAFLEKQLADTEQQLAEARQEIAFLKASQEATSIMCRNEQSILPKDIASPCVVHDEVTQTEQLEMAPLDPYLSSTDISNAFIIDIDTLSLPSPVPNQSLSLPGPPPCCSDPLPSTNPDPECSTCATKPLPSPSESTTPCAQAFVLISQQNFRNLDPETIRMWLAQGLRRARKDGEGCRVENGALLRLLDYMSSF
ncbi:hypothetical protein BDU57DRAFT_450635 [Ampelomyces quisqualis]|uniref:BZIP domain-containing protein n=1 Tax=Ampelomyces quisqualis TaxID=50730 RepID=A0A6A5QQ32_AMPQU|nr:hypothetical protein BDU57DRAFT_450635 [Ampelomyces quisqualis]